LRKKNCAKLFSFHEQKFAKNTTDIAQKKVHKTAQNSLRFMRKNSAKVRKKKICAKIAQILRKFCAKNIVISWKPYFQINSQKNSKNVGTNYYLE